MKEQNDSDEAVEAFLKNIGKALFEDIRDEGESTDDVYNIVMSWKKTSANLPQQLGSKTNPCFENGSGVRPGARAICFKRKISTF